MLEIMTRRWYRERELTGFWSGVTSDGTAYVTTSYEADGRRHHLAAAFVDTQDLDDIAGAISRRAAQYPQGESVYVDLYAAATAGEELANDAQGGARARRRAAARPAHRARRARADPRRLRRRRDHAAPLGRRRLGARPRAAVRAPGDGRAPEPVAHVGVRAGADRLARGRLPVPRRRSLQPEGRAAVRARRGARASRSCATRTGASSRCPSSSTCWPRRWSRCAASRPAARRASACCGTACG